MANKTHQSDGGKARAALLSPEERSEIARTAAKARWANVGDTSRLPKATHDGNLDLAE